ncbi:MAG: sulfite exporter TauE/SafE family protein [Candidatus Methylacidiphilales bacterium]|nr:sulfite exporter TauE/SafE family protein [Candidatus Methylacidiphilales bacterium]
MTPEFATPLAALAAGAVTSLHCAGMCGPLACTACPARPGARLRDGLLYHGARITAYSLLGAALGWSGASLGQMLGQPIWKILPWAFLLLFAAIALSWDPARFARLPASWRSPLQRAAQLQGWRGALLLGFFTPLIPCGPLLLAAGTATAAGSATHGALLMACFGLGTVALLETVRLQAGALQRFFPPPSLRRLQQGLALIACLIVATRLAWPLLVPASKACPLCP